MRDLALSAIAAFPNMDLLYAFLLKYDAMDEFTRNLPPHIIMARVAILAVEDGNG